MRFKVSGPAAAFVANGAGAANGAANATGNAANGAANNAGNAANGANNNVGNAANNQNKRQAATMGINVRRHYQRLYKLYGSCSSKGSQVLFHGDGGQSFVDFPVRYCFSNSYLWSRLKLTATIIQY
jgi:hypothetical protein